MPASKRLSTRLQSPTHSFQDGGNVPTTTHEPVDRRISTRGWSVESLLELGKGNFEEVERVSVRKMDPLRIVETVRRYEERGCPLILEEWHLRKEWEESILNVDYLVERLPDQELPTRNVYNRSDRTTTLKEYIDYSRALPPFAPKDEAERYYGKDAPVPPAWAEWLAGAIPEPMQALRSGDIMSYLKDLDRPETLMCYFGVGDTYTPAHKDLCASIGHNLLTYSENDGSAFWFLSSTSDADAASTWFHGMNEELDLETHLATVDEWAQAPFKVYICQQRLGDFVLVPKRGCHQVINHGGLSIKTSWSRMSIESLELSLGIELSIYRRVCRAEVHRVRLNIWEALRECRRLIETSSAEEVEEETELLRRLVPLFSKILAEEFDPDLDSYEHILRKGESIHAVCDCCGGDIFQSFFRCIPCTPPNSNPRLGLALCAGCYCEGRTCLCGPEAKMQPCQLRDIKLLLADRSAAIQLLRNVEAPTKSKANMSRGSDLLELNHAPLFRLANHLLRLRSHLPKKARKCNMYRRRGVQHEVAFDNARNCAQCHAALCYEHMLENLGIHCTELWWQDIMENPKNFKYAQWHEKHVAQTGSAREASFDIVKPGVEARIGWAQYFARLAWKYQDCRPISDHARVGWYDPKTLNNNKPKHVNTHDPEFAPSAENVRQMPRRSAASTLATPSRIQAKRNAAKDVMYVEESSDEIAANVSDVAILDKKAKGKRRRLTDSEDTDSPAAERAPKRRKAENQNKAGVYKFQIPVHVHVPRRRPTAPTQSDATSNDIMDILWDDDGQDRTTEASEGQTLPPRPAPKSKQRLRRSITKATITIPPALKSPARTRAQRSKAVPASPVQGPPTPLSDTSYGFIPTSVLLPASNQGIPPFDHAAFKAEFGTEVTAAVAAQFTGIREEMFIMRASIEALGQKNGDEARSAEIGAREAALTAKEEEYERLKGKETELVEGLAALDRRHQEMEQELMERFAIKERELLEKASGTQLQIEQLVQGQVNISVDQEAEEMELLVQGIGTEEPTNCEVSIRQGEPSGVVSQAEFVVPFRVLEASASEEVTFQEVLLIASEVDTAEETLHTEKLEQGFNSSDAGTDGQQIFATAPMASEDYEIHPGAEMIPSSAKATEDQPMPGSLTEGFTAMGYAIDPQVSKPASPADLDEDAEGDVDVGVVENSALASTTIGFS